MKTARALILALILCTVTASFLGGTLAKFSMIEKGNIEPLMESESLYRCLTCFACVERCPRGVEPAKLVEAVRLVAIRRKGENRMTADDVPQRLDSEIPQQAIVSAFRKYHK